MTDTDGIARTIGRAAAAARVAARTTLPVDSNPVPVDWNHVTKVDPEHGKRLPVVYPLYLHHTDGISVGGSREVTPENTTDTFELLEYVPTPVFHEPSAPEHVTDGSRDRASFLAIPEVLNGDTESLVGKLGAGIEHVRNDLAPDLIRRKAGWLPAGVRDGLAEFAASWLLSDAVFEAYIIQNEDSAAAREANVTEADLLGPREAAHRAMAAERRLGSELLYLEYSGTYGGEEAERLLSAIDDATDWSRVWYGGGIDSREATERMLEAGADTVVVGDAFHDVATEEAALTERARDDLGAGADRDRVAEWLDGQVDPAGTNAARFLSTVPSVADPTATARRYLVAGITTWLAVEALADGVEDASSPTSLKRSIRRAGVPSVEELSELGEHGRLYAGNFALAAVASRSGLEVGSMPVDHLSMGVPTEIDLE
jgi:phosphoglycerol geranylgeranyltransferase